MKVIVLGGGVAGMSAAHELAERGFEVVVYEQRAVAGGKARSVDAITGTGGRRALPGEHGFRFFPGFYQHLPDTMRRIPYPGRLNGVLDNLVTSTQLEVAREDRRNEIIGPAHFPLSVSDWEATLRFGLDVATHLGIPLEDQVHFVGLLNDLLSACPARRFDQYENESWWEFADAEPWHVVVANGSTRHVRGRVESPTVTFRSRWEDFVDTVAGREDPRRMFATRRLRLRGNYLWLWRARDMFPR